jgi:uncharacterized protein CbrC (UPF0167 family)
MPQHYEFKYFRDYQIWAKFSPKRCDVCHGDACLEGIYFDQSSDLEAVCLSCLTTGKIRVSIPTYLINRLTMKMQHAHPDWSEDLVSTHIIELTEALSLTPPVPWVQNNEWPICTDDFACYIGEANQDRLNRMASDGNGLDYLRQITEKEILDIQGTWDAIASEWVTVFLFECLETEEIIAIVQAF